MTLKTRYSLFHYYFNIFSFKYITIINILLYKMHQGAEKIADALKENRSITNIDLVSRWLKLILLNLKFVLYNYLKLNLYFQGGNDIHAKGITAIAEVLKDNTVITAVRKSIFL